jgi:hypothetical protein
MGSMSAAELMCAMVFNTIVKAVARRYAAVHSSLWQPLVFLNALSEVRIGTLGIETAIKSRLRV